MRTNVDAYVKQASKARFLTREEQFDLARKYRAGDVAAGQKLVSSNLRFAVKMAHRYVRNGVALEDLIQEANEGLCIALRKYDPERGFIFSTYAVWWIRTRLQRFCSMSASMVQMNPNRVHMVTAAVKRAKKVDPRACDTDIAALVSEASGIALEFVTAVMVRRPGDVSVDAPIGQEGDAPFVSMLPSRDTSPEEEAVSSNMSERVRSVLCGMQLSQRDLDILNARLCVHDDDAETLANLGRRHGVSRERLRQCEEKLKGRLQRTLEVVL